MRDSAQLKLFIRIMRHLVTGGLILLEIRRATEADKEYIFSLLKRTGLTTSGIEETSYFHICTEGEKTVGCFGIVCSNDGAMLRSFAVEPEMQGMGIGHFMAIRTLKYAIDAGILPLYLLTNTADKFFAKFGFTEIERKDIPDIIMDSTTLGEYCPFTSICMKAEKTGCQHLTDTVYACRI